jgi:hypothetical protein
MLVLSSECERMYVVAVCTEMLQRQWDSRHSINTNQQENLLLLVLFFFLFLISNVLLLPKTGERRDWIKPCREGHYTLWHLKETKRKSSSFFFQIFPDGSLDNFCTYMIPQSLTQMKKIPEVLILSLSMYKKYYLEIIFC